MKIGQTEISLNSPSGLPSMQASELADEILKRIRAGEQVSAKDFATEDSELLAELEQLVPLMIAMERVSHAEAHQALQPAKDSTSPISVSETLAGEIPAPESLADGRYKPLRLIGHGSMGVVYLAEDITLKRQVALKLPKADFLDQAAIGRFQREAQILAHVQHPRIASVYDFGYSDGHYYMAMEYVPGISLAEHLVSGSKYQPDEAARLICEIAEAIECAHASGVVHRDLKPANVILNSKGDPFVTDFGLARSEQKGDTELTSAGALLGSPAYMAPEQVQAQHDLVGPATDTYALGVILYQLLVGQRPFEGSVYSVLEQVVGAPPAPIKNADCDPELQAICYKAINKRIDDRYRSAQALALDLQKFLDRDATPVLAIPRSTKWFRLAIVGCAIALVVALSVFMTDTNLLPRSTLELTHTEDRDQSGKVGGSLKQMVGQPPRLLPVLAESKKTSRGQFVESSRFGASYLSLAIADVDGDRDVDVVLVSEECFSLWLNDGQGSFSRSGQVFETVSRPSFAAFGDLNADGMQDLALASEEAFAVWVNQGNGQFEPAGASLPFANAGRPSLGDLDQDGDLDVYLPSQTEQQPDSILLNVGSGILRDYGIQIEGSTTREVALADLDGDGDLDVYRANFRNEDDLWWNLGQDRFERCSQSFAAALHSHGVCAADLDQDFDLDLVVADNHLFLRKDQEIASPGSRVWWNDGEGRFSTELLVGLDRFVSQVQVADLNGDATPDIWAGRQQIFWGGVRPRQACVALRDAEKQGPNLTFLGDVGAADGLLADLDLDGDVDCISVGESGCSVWLNIDHEDELAQPPLFVSSGQAIGDPAIDSNDVELFDADGDGDLDAFISNYQAANELWLNDGKAFFEKSHQSFTMLGAASKVASSANMTVCAGDVDNDGDSDLITTGLGIPITLWKNDGQAEFDGSMISDFATVNRYCAALHDFNNDGALDLVVGTFGTPSEIWFNDGLGNFEQTQFLGETDDYSIVISDCDDDGSPDLLFGTAGPEVGIKRWEWDGEKFIQAETIDTVSWASHIQSKSGVAVWSQGIALADLDGDGSRDVIGSCCPYPSSVWLNDGAGKFHDQRTIVNQFGSASLLAKDFDQDGNVDLLFGNDPTEPMEFVRGLGNAEFSSPVLYHKRTGCLDMSAADLDQDGDLDVFIANKGVNSVWLNQTK